MVVPISMDNSKLTESLKSKQYVGNDLIINLDNIISKVSVIGNNCKVRIDNNQGTLKVIGNTCTIYVIKGNGKICYNGNEGRIHLGPEIDAKKIVYIGNGGKIIRDNNTKDIPIITMNVGEIKTSKNSLHINNKSHTHFKLNHACHSLNFANFGVPHISKVRYQDTRK